MGASIVIQADQKIVIAGTMTVNSSLAFIARYNSDGSPDTSFGLNGYIVTTITVVNEADAVSMQLQPDGKFVMGTTTEVPFKVIIGRFNTDGTPDSSFGIAGVTDIAAVPANSMLFQIALSSNGSIVVFAIVGIAPNSELLIVKYTNQGVLDTTFGAPHGYVITMPPMPVEPGDFGSLALQQNGYIVGATGVAEDQGGILTAVRYINSPVLLPTIITSLDVSGTAQPKSIVGVFNGTTQICLVDDITGSWACAGTGENITAVAHYPYAAVNILSTQPSPPCPVLIEPQSALSRAVIAKYCPCLG